MTRHNRISYGSAAAMLAAFTLAGGTAAAQSAPAPVAPAQVVLAPGANPAYYPQRSPQPMPYQAAPWQSSPWGGTPWGGGTPWNNGGWGGMPWNPMGSAGPWNGGWLNPSDPKGTVTRSWDQMMNTPSRMGTMPGGWRAPSISVPNPVDVGDKFGNQMQNQMQNQMGGNR